jgi:hypothetical protein
MEMRSPKGFGASRARRVLVGNGGWGAFTVTPEAAGMKPDTMAKVIPAALPVTGCPSIVDAESVAEMATPPPESNTGDTIVSAARELGGLIAIRQIAITPSRGILSMDSSW